MRTSCFETVKHGVLETPIAGSIGFVQQMGVPEGKISSFSGSVVVLPHADEAGGAETRAGKKEPVLKSAVGESVFDVCEVFSPPRICEAASQTGLRGGWSLDVSSTCVITGRKWDFRRVGDRRAAKRLVMQDRPQVLILSPPCALFSSLQRWSRYGPPEVRCPDRWAEAIAFVNFAMELCEVQHRAGRGFVFEHPKFASSWTATDLSGLMAREGVHEAVLDMCRFDMVSKDELGVGLCRKPTRLMTNLEPVAEMMSKTCKGGHRHVALISGRPSAAAIYPPKFLYGTGEWHSDVDATATGAF